MEKPTNAVKQITTDKQVLAELRLIRELLTALLKKGMPSHQIREVDEQMTQWVQRAPEVKLHEPLILPESVEDAPA